MSTAIGHQWKSVYKSTTTQEKKHKEKSIKRKKRRSIKRKSIKKRSIKRRSIKRKKLPPVSTKNCHKIYEHHPPLGGRKYHPPLRRRKPEQGTRVPHITKITAQKIAIR